MRHQIDARLHTVIVMSAWHQKRRCQILSAMLFEIFDAHFAHKLVDVERLRDHRIGRIAIVRNVLSKRNGLLEAGRDQVPVS